MDLPAITHPQTHPRTHASKHPGLSHRSHLPSMTHLLHYTGPVCHNTHAAYTCTHTYHAHNCTYRNTHTHIHIHTHAHTNMHTYTHTYTHTHTHTHAHTCTRKHTHTHTHTHTVYDRRRYAHPIRKPHFMPNKGLCIYIFPNRCLSPPHLSSLHPLPSHLSLSFLLPSFPSTKPSFSRPYLRLSRGGVPSQDSSVSRSTIPIPTSKAVVNRRATASNDTDQA